MSDMPEEMAANSQQGESGIDRPYPGNGDPREPYDDTVEAQRRPLNQGIDEPYTGGLTRAPGVDDYYRYPRSPSSSSPIVTNPKTIGLTNTQRLTLFNRNRAFQLLCICFACVMAIFIGDAIMSGGKPETMTAILDIFKFVISGTIGYLFSQQESKN